MTVTPTLRHTRVLALLIALQLVGAVHFAGAYHALAQRGVASPLALLFTPFGSLCLYAAGWMAACNPTRGKPLFALAAVGFGLSVPFWGWTHDWTGIVLLGATLGAAGGWLVHRAEVGGRG